MVTQAAVGKNGCTVGLMSACCEVLANYREDSQMDAEISTSFGVFDMDVSLAESPVFEFRTTFFSVSELDFSIKSDLLWATTSADQRRRMQRLMTDLATIQQPRKYRISAGSAEQPYRPAGIC